MDHEMDQDTSREMSPEIDQHDTHDKIITLRANGLTIMAICRALNIPECRVRKHLERAGLVRDGIRGAHAKRYRYGDKYLTILELAELAKCSRTTMWRRLKRWDGDARRAVQGG